MKIIISPAKKMEECQDIFEPGRFPVFMEQTEKLYCYLKNLPESELQKVFKANDQITRQNYERYQTMELDRALSPALLTYVGIQYQYMAPKLFSYEQWEYVKKHLRILSGFYGILRPCDRVTPYRLEMQTKLAVDGAKDLYGFWGRTLYDALTEEAFAGAEAEMTGGSETYRGQAEAGTEENDSFKRVIVNLASKEYSKAIEPYLTDEDHYITCVFGVLQNGKIKVKATEAKMARGEMVRFMAERKIEDPEEIKEFDCLGYRYSAEHSDHTTYVFIKE